jgi:hypothetical protein
MPEFVAEVLTWAGKNKDALLALGAFLGPVTAIIAVVIGPFVQTRIAQQQNKQAEKQFALTEQQARFASIGASEQKWISRFSRDVGAPICAGFPSEFNNYND